MTAPLEMQRAIEAREDFFFAEDFQQVIQARAGVAAGDGAWPLPVSPQI